MSKVLGSTIETIRSFIDEELEPNAQLPNEQALVQMTGASRGTVREAIARLETDGIVNKVWGVGTFVAEAPPPEGFGFLSVRSGIPGILETTGGEAAVHSFAAIPGPPDPDLFLEFERATTCSSTRVFSLDGQPAILIRDRMVAETERGVLDTTPLHAIEGRVPAQLLQIGLELRRIELSLTAALLDDEEQALFGLGTSEPVLRTTGEGFDPEGRRILLTNVLYRTTIMGLHVTAS